MNLASTHVHACPRQARARSRHCSRPLVLAVADDMPWQAPCEPLRLFAGVCFLVPASARATRQTGPGRGSDGWPFAALRVPCGARSSGPSHNSLRSLRSLRSNRRDESDDEARQGARPEVLCSSAAPIRPAQASPAALPATGSVVAIPSTTTGSATGQPGSARRACEAPSSTGFGARARSAPRDLTRRACPSAANAVSTASCATGPRTRAAQGSRSAAKTASAAGRALPGCPVAAPLPAERNVNDTKGPQRDCGGMASATAGTPGSARWLERASACRGRART